MSSSDVEVDREVIGPADESQDYESILGNENASTFSRYAVPPQFEGNSSDDEQKEVVDEPQGEVHDDEEYVAVDDSQYAPLVADEFGDFVSSESFGDYYTPDVVVRLQDRLAAELQINNPSEEKGEDAVDAAAVVDPVQSNVRVGIPPLDANKIQLIKAAMAKMTIRPPNLGAMAFADTLERSRLRLGDELPN